MLKLGVAELLADAKILFCPAKRFLLDLKTSDKCIDPAFAPAFDPLTPNPNFDKPIMLDYDIKKTNTILRVEKKVGN